MESTRARSILCLLGGFRLLVAGCPRSLPTQAQRLLALLAVRCPAQSRSALAGTLWDDVPEARAQANLRNAVCRVRAVDGALLSCSRREVALDADLDVDLRDARTYAHELMRGNVTESDTRAVTVLEDDLLPTWDEEWLVIERERQRQVRMHALETLSGSLCRLGRYPEAITAAFAAVSAEPLRESAQRALISAYLGEGNVSEAVRQLTIYDRLLGAELGIAASPDLHALVGRAARTTDARIVL